MVATSDEPTQPADELGRECVAAPHANPDVDKGIDTEVEVVRREPCAVHRTDGGPNHDVGSDPFAHQSAEHACLDGSEIATAGKDERRAHRA